jgi:hypothetical protein
MTELRTRIVRTGSIAPADIVANPRNWRQHPRHQQEALRDLVGQVGWVQGVVINERTGLLVDGHLRAELADEEGASEIPAVWVDLSEEEEALVLAALDPIGNLAIANPEALTALLDELTVEGDGLQGLLADLAGAHSAEVPLDELPGDAPDDRDFWPKISLQVSHETKADFDAWWASVPGDDDDAKLRDVMGSS